MTKKLLRNIGLSLLCVVIVSTTIACKNTCRKYYWRYDCYWVSLNPLIVLDKGCGSGEMIIDNVRYEFYTGISNNATYIKFRVNQNEVLWKADTKLKGEFLYLTITIDNISNYKGQTIVLHKSLEKPIY